MKQTLGSNSLETTYYILFELPYINVQICLKCTYAYLNVSSSCVCILFWFMITRTFLRTVLETKYHYYCGMSLGDCSIELGNKYIFLQPSYVPSNYCNVLYFLVQITWFPVGMTLKWLLFHRRKKPRRTSFRWECGQLEYNGLKHCLKEHTKSKRLLWKVINYQIKIDHWKFQKFFFEAH